MAELLLDISRGFARADNPAPTGIDRVERAYLSWALKQSAHFLVRVPGHDIIATGDMVQAALAAKRTSVLGNFAKFNTCQWHLLKQAMTRKSPKLAAQFIYLNVGHANLKPHVLQLLATKGLGKFVAMVHDMIPLDHPRFCRFDQIAPAQTKLKFVAQNADEIITVSRHSAERIAHHASANGHRPKISVIPPGIEISGKTQTAQKPHFVWLGTLEPRKNITLVLDVLDQLSPTTKQDFDLHIVGQRGWEAPEVLARLDHHDRINPNLHVHGALADHAVHDLMRSASALLFPTCEEGFGIPLYEARAIGLPVLASDLPVLKEHGSALTQYLPTQDVGAWCDAIIRAIHQNPGAPQPVPCWDDHFAQLETLLYQPTLRAAS